MKKILFLASALFLPQLVSFPTLATLGENESSVDLDSQDLSHARHVRVAQKNYSVHQIVSDSTMILEYADHNGVVFAVSWTGPTMPVLSGLLGRYADDVSKRLKQEVARFPAGNTRSRSSQTSLDAGRITIENAGHMGSHHGRAYIPNLIPESLNLADIK